MEMRILNANLLPAGSLYFIIFLGKKCDLKGSDVVFFIRAILNVKRLVVIVI